MTLAPAIAPATAVFPCQEPAVAELYFSEKEAELNEAKALCGRCPLTQQCLQGALERQEPWGVWGGEILVNGVIASRKRSRGRPRKASS